MKAPITGTTLPVLEIGLEQGDKVISEPGQFSWMSPNISLQTTARTAGAKGIFGVLGRALSGGGLFMNEYQTTGGKGMVAFAAKVPGAIMEVQLTPGKTYLVHRHGFLCGTEGVELAVGFQRSLGAGIFGGDGMILQKLSGNATAWVELGGEIVSYDLAPGESLQVHPGHVGMFEGSVNFDITMIPGLKCIVRRRRLVHRAPDRARKDLAANADHAQSRACAAAVYGTGRHQFCKHDRRRHWRFQWRRRWRRGRWGAWFGAGRLVRRQGVVPKIGIGPDFEQWRRRGFRNRSIRPISLLF